MQESCRSQHSWLCKHQPLCKDFQALESTCSHKPCTLVPPIRIAVTSGGSFYIHSLELEPLITNLLLTSVRRGSSYSSYAVSRIILTSLTCQPVPLVHAQCLLFKGFLQTLLCFLTQHMAKGRASQKQPTVWSALLFITVGSCNKSANLNDTYHTLKMLMTQAASILPRCL